MTLLDESAGAWRTVGQTAPPAKSALVEIAEALLELGGSAHRDTVIDRVAIRRGEMFASDSLRDELVCAFDRHRAAAAREGRPSLLHLPFGEGSRRWSLTRSGALGAPFGDSTAAAVALQAARDAA